MKPTLIKGDLHIDERGKLSFCNDFDMEEVRRFYIVENADTKVARAWQGHQREQKWFFVISGSFMIGLVEPDNWHSPSLNLPVSTYTLKATDNSVLHIPGGFANGFKALEPHSKMMVFSNFTLEEGRSDHFRFDSSLWFTFNS